MYKRTAAVTQLTTVLILAISMILLALLSFVTGSTAASSADNFSAYLPFINKPRKPYEELPGLEWALSYGSSDTDEANDVAATDDKGVVVLGNTDFADYGSWILKLAGDGSIFWQKAVPGSLSSVLETADTGLIMGGRLNSDAWILKTDKDGKIIWQKTYGGSFTDGAGSIQETTDGGFIVAGSTESAAGYATAWILKLDGNGNIVWQKKYQGDFRTSISRIRETSDGGYIAAGSKRSSESYISTDGWILKLNSDGSTAWQKIYGGDEQDAFGDVWETDDGDYIATGFSQSFSSSYDGWVLRLNSDGSIRWQKRYSSEGGSFDVASHLLETPEGGFLLAGSSMGSPLSVTSIWLAKLNDAGEITWQKAYGGGVFEIATDLESTPDGGYVVSGYTESFGDGGSDFWVMKVDAEGSINDCTAVVPATVIASDTTVAPQTSTVSVQTTAVTPVDTNITPVNMMLLSNAVCTP